MILEEDLQELFYDLHESGLFADGKTISDAVLLRPAATILQAYRSERLTVDFDLRAFFDANFETVAIGETGYETEAGITVESHIDRLQYDPSYDRQLCLDAHYLWPHSQWQSYVLSR